jgi:hypothetical protein
LLQNIEEVCMATVLDKVSNFPDVVSSVALLLQPESTQKADVFSEVDLLDFRIFLRRRSFSGNHFYPVKKSITF